MNRPRRFHLLALALGFDNHLHLVHYLTHAFDTARRFEERNALRFALKGAGQRDGPVTHARRDARRRRSCAGQFLIDGFEQIFIGDRSFTEHGADSLQEEQLCRARKRSSWQGNRLYGRRSVSERGSPVRMHCIRSAAPPPAISEQMFRICSDASDRIVRK